MQEKRARRQASPKCQSGVSGAAIDEAVAKLDAWYEKQDELSRNPRDASNELEEALMARASHMLNEPVITGPDFRGRIVISTVVAGKKRDREHVQRYIVRERKGQEESDEGKRKAMRTMVDH